MAEVFGIADVVRPPQMKTKQIPDDFRDWIEAQTFEIAAPIARIDSNERTPERVL